MTDDEFNKAKGDTIEVLDEVCDNLWAAMEQASKLYDSADLEIDALRCKLHDLALSILDMEPGE